MKLKTNNLGLHKPDGSRNWRYFLVRKRKGQVQLLMRGKLWGRSLTKALRFDGLADARIGQRLFRGAIGVHPKNIHKLLRRYP